MDRTRPSSSSLVPATRRECSTDTNGSSGVIASLTVAASVGPPHEEWPLAHLHSAATCVFPRLLGPAQSRKVVRSDALGITSMSAHNKMARTPSRRRAESECERHTCKLDHTQNPDLG